MPDLEAQPVQRLAQLQALYDGAPVGLCFIDSKLRFVSINERLAEFNGRSVAEHLGQPVADMVPEFSVRSSRICNGLFGAKPSTITKSKHHISAPTIPARILLANYQPLRDEAGEVLGVSVAMTDITPCKKAGHALGDSEARLPAPVFNTTLRFIDELKRKTRRLTAHVS